MANGMTVDQLYEAFMDIDEEGVSTGKTPFAEDVFGFFGKEELGGYTQKKWAQQYGTYLPTWDPSQVNLAGRERDLDFTTAMDTLKTTQAATERVYATEMDTLSTALGAELSKGRQIAGGIGLRSGGLQSAIQDTIATTGSKAKDFGDRTRIAGEDTENIYNSAMVDSALDFEKTERQEKEEFYDRTMAAIMRLMDTGAFDDPFVECPEGEVLCADQQYHCGTCPDGLDAGPITEEDLENNPTLIIELAAQNECVQSGGVWDYTLEECGSGDAPGASCDTYCCTCSGQPKFAGCQC
tara:strand:+ start:3371 stop:4258 length:888 start_codon:yes stop_codon:yes gene_type:complete